MKHRKKEGGYKASTEVLLISLRSTHLSLSSCFAVPFPQGKRVGEEGRPGDGAIRRSRQDLRVRPSRWAIKTVSGAEGILFRWGYKVSGRGGPCFRDFPQGKRVGEEGGCDLETVG